MKDREKEGLGFSKFLRTNFQVLISIPEFPGGLKIVLVLNLDNRENQE
jgi:hypothetical protein